MEADSSLCLGYMPMLPFLVLYLSATFADRTCMGFSHELLLTLPVLIDKQISLLTCVRRNYSVLWTDTERAVGLLRRYQANLTSPDEQTLNNSVGKVSAILGSQLFQALLGKEKKKSY